MVLKSGSVFARGVVTQGLNGVQRKWAGRVQVTFQDGTSAHIHPRNLIPCLVEVSALASEATFKNLSKLIISGWLLRPQLVHVLQSSANFDQLTIRSASVHGKLRCRACHLQHLRARCRLLQRASFIPSSGVEKSIAKSIIFRRM